MNVSDYKHIFEEIFELSFDADSINAVEDTSNEDIEKCKYIAAMLEVLNDVPKAKMEYIFKRKKIEFDYIDFLGD